jgi:hypothetical protein
MKTSLLTALLMGLLVAALNMTGVLGRSRALGVRPAVAGTWDAVFDDTIDVTADVEGEDHQARTGAGGGRVAFHDAGSFVQLEVDCARPELVCPQELLPRELTLDNRSGDLSDDGRKFVLSFEGEGEGACRLLAGSMATADVDLQGSPVTADFHAVALTGGTVSVVVSPACLGADTGLPADAQVVLSTGFTASRR